MTYSIQKHTKQHSEVITMPSPSQGTVRSQTLRKVAFPSIRFPEFPFSWLRIIQQIMTHRSP